MASNRIPEKLTELFALADDAIDGAENQEAAVPLKQNTAAAIATDLTAARTALAEFKSADTAKDTADGAVQTADSNAKAFLAKAKKAITGVFGDTWQSVFGEAGFADHSLALPTTQDDRFEMIGKIPAFLTAHADCQDPRPAVMVTPQTATALHAALGLARGTANQAATDYGHAIAARDAAAETLRIRLRGLIGELRQIIAADSPIWYAFGLNAPADPSTPGVPLTGPLLTVGAAGSVHASWGIARRAESYHVWLQIDGTDAEPVRVATTHDRAYTFTGLPTGKQVKVSITGVNDAGSGVPSPQVAIMVM